MTSTALDNIITEISNNIKKEKSPIVPDKTVALLYQDPNYAYTALTLILSDNDDTNNQITLKQQSCLFILHEIFNYIYNKIQQKDQCSEQFSIDFQNYFAQCVFKPSTPIIIMQHLLEALYESQWPIIKEIQNAHCELIESQFEDNESNNLENITTLINNLAQFTHENEFSLYFKILTQTYQLLPTEIQSILAIELAYSNKRKLIETAVLMLLHPEKVVRQQIAMALLDNAHQLSSISLRRIILIRNWLSTEEQQDIDQIILTCRKLQTICAPIQKGRIIQLYANSFDSLGNQKLFITLYAEHHYFLYTLELKENNGLNCSQIKRVKKQEQIDKLTNHLLKKNYFVALNEQYLHDTLWHFIQLQTKQNKPPSPWFLDLIEKINVNWQPNSLNFSETLNELLNNNTQQLMHSKYFNNALNISQNWPQTQLFAKYWEEHSVCVQEKLMPLFKNTSQLATPINDVIDEVIDLIFEPKRKVWMQRFILLSIWSKNVLASNFKYSWHTFLYLAKLCETEQPLNTIPLMQTLGAQTLLLCSQEILDKQQEKNEVN